MAQKHGPATADVEAQSGSRHAVHQPAEHANRRASDGHQAHPASHPEAAESVNGRHDEQDADDGAAETSAAAPQDQDRIADLAAALAAAKAEAAEHWDKYLRERAEMENYKRRLERNQADQIKRERKDLLLKTLGVLDNLERAVAYQVDSAAPVDPKALLMGLKMTYAQFKDLLASEGLQEVKTVGEPFDPALHEAVSTAVAPDLPEGQIVEELQKGYLLGGDLLRPARVKVATRQ